MAAPDAGLVAFLRQRKKFWLLPLLLVFALFGLLVIASSDSEENFIYTLD